MMSTQRQLRAINVQDALRYLDMIKVESDGQPEVYKEFLDIMKDFKLQKIDTPGAMIRVANLFQGYPTLMENYNIFLPKGYEILCSLNVQGSHYVALITPLGIATHPPTASPTLTPPNSGVIARRAPHSLNTATPREIATAYLQEVKSRLAHEPEQYHVFLETLIAYQVSSPTAEAFNQMMQPLGLILSEHPDLLRGFYRVAGIFELQRKQKQRAKL